MIIYLQVDLLSVRWLRGECSIDRLLEGEGEGGGDPGVARGAQLGTFDGESWNWQIMQDHFWNSPSAEPPAVDQSPGVLMNEHILED